MQKLIINCGSGGIEYIDLTTEEEIERLEESEKERLKQEQEVIKQNEKALALERLKAKAKNDATLADLLDCFL